MISNKIAKNVIVMNILRKFLIIQLFFICITSYSQSRWTLETCVDYALKHNLKLKDLGYQTKSNKESYRQSFRDLLPTIDGNSSYDIQFGRSIDPNNNGFVSTQFFSNNYSINAYIDIFKGFQKLNTIAFTKFMYKAVQKDNLQEKYLLAFKVMSAFYDVEFYKDLLKITKEQRNISSVNYNLVKRKIELGLMAGSDLYEVKSALIADKLVITQSKNNLKIAMLKLIQEMNLKNVSAIKINTLKDEILENNKKLLHLSVDSIYHNALSFIPVIKAEELRVKAARKDISIARGNLYPSLKFATGYSTGYYETNVDAMGKILPFRTQIKENASQFIGFSLQIPISERWYSRSQIKQKKIALLRAVNNLDIQKQELNNVIQKLIQSYEASKIEYEQTKENESSRLLAFNIAQKKYEKGLISIVQLYQSKNYYAKAQNENLQVKLKLKVQKKTLNFYMGLPVFNIQ